MAIHLSSSLSGQRRRAARNTLTFVSFVGPLVAGLLFFVYLPIIWGFWISFYSARYTITPTRFIGFENYLNLLTDADFRSSLVTFTIFAAFIVPITVLASMGLALLVNNIKWGRTFFRSVFFIPSACSVVVAAMIWRNSLFLGTTQGFMNTLLSSFHVSSIVWIGAGPIPWYWLVLVSCRLWLGLGFNMILFLAGLQQISPSLYEAAAVDGTRSGWNRFRYITFPLLRNTTAIVISLNLISAFQAFDEFYNILNGTLGVGNLNLAKSPLIYLFEISFGTASQDYGKGSAGAFILAAIIILVTVLQTRFYGFGDADNRA